MKVFMGIEWGGLGYPKFKQVDTNDKDFGEKVEKLMQEIEKDGVDEGYLVIALKKWR